jgi:nitronate monooxygenase
VIHTHEKLQATLKLGYAAVQIGTAFAVTEEGDAHINFKQVLAGAKTQDIVEFMSVAGLPARAVKTIWLERYLRRESVLQAEAAAFEEANKGKIVDRVAKCSGALMCLSVCGLRDGIPKIGQFCIDTQLAAALRGELSRGLFFRGALPVSFGTAIRPVRDLIDYMLTGRMPAGLDTLAAA